MSWLPRGGLDHVAGDLLAGGQCTLAGLDWLRFTLDETIALVGARFAQWVDADACARLFERVDGWPLGLQLAMAAMARSADPRQASTHSPPAWTARATGSSSCCSRTCRPTTLRS